MGDDMNKCDDYWCEHYGKDHGECDRYNKKDIANDKNELQIIIKRRADKLMELDNISNREQGQSR